MVITFCKQKGGTGATTTSLSLAKLASRLNKSVLLIDLDPQASATAFLMGFDDDNENNLLLDQIVYQSLIFDSELPIQGIPNTNIDIVPSSSLLARAETELAYQQDTLDNLRANRLKKQLNKVKNNYDVVIIDCPPSLGLLTLNAFCASDQVVIVSSIGKFERNSTKYCLKELERFKSEYSPTTNILGILLTMTDPFKITESTRKKMQADPELGTRLLTVEIPKNNAIRNATDEGMSIFDYSPLSPSGKAYMAFWDEIHQRVS